MECGQTEVIAATDFIPTPSARRDELMVANQSIRVRNVLMRRSLRCLLNIRLTCPQNDHPMHMTKPREPFVRPQPIRTCVAAHLFGILRIMRRQQQGRRTPQRRFDCEDVERSLRQSSSLQSCGEISLDDELTALCYRSPLAAAGASTGRLACCGRVRGQNLRRGKKRVRIHEPHAQSTCFGKGARSHRSLPRGNTLDPRV